MKIGIPNLEKMFIEKLEAKILGAIISLKAIHTFKYITGKPLLLVNRSKICFTTKEVIYFREELYMVSLPM